MDEALSVRLCDALDAVGASETFRHLRQTCAAKQDMINSIRDNDVDNAKAIQLTFGSHIEGTTTSGLKSDIDNLIYGRYPVIDNIETNSSNIELIMIRSKNTKPGYVKLQTVKNGQPVVLYHDIEKEGLDVDNNLCLKHIYKAKDDKRDSAAFTMKVDNLEIDSVYAFHGEFIPDFANECIGRDRRFDWPSSPTIKKCSNMGFFVVERGHPSSPEKELERRVSFSLQERELMFSLNPVQHKCYIFLKMIKKDILHKKIRKCISSYHLKTCLFHVLENSPNRFCKKNQLLYCVFECLEELLICVQSGNCPNFFNAEENMFDKDRQRRIKPRLVKELISIINLKDKIINYIHCDNVREIIQAELQVDPIVLKKEQFRLKMLVIRDFSQLILKLSIKGAACESIDENLKFYHRISEALTIKEAAPHQTLNNTIETAKLILPYVHIRLAQTFVSKALTFPETFDQNMENYCTHLHEGVNAPIKYQLLSATVMYNFGRFKQCVKLLHKTVALMKNCTTDDCTCNDGFGNHVYDGNDEALESILPNVSQCFMFLRSDKVITPEPLQYEMYRTKDKYQVPWSTELWFKMAVIDERLYVFLLQYLAYENMSNIEQERKLEAINSLERVLSKQPPYQLGHRTTGYNVLGWIYARERMLHKAVSCFQKSWKERPNANAAKWHLFMTIYEHFRSIEHCYGGVFLSQEKKSNLQKTIYIQV